MPPLNVLILGGTGEAADLSARLAGDARFEAVVSLAGRTRAPRPSPIAQRVGGFGGVQGLVGYISDRKVDAVVAALHPFAAQMKRHAAEAARIAAVPLALVDRPMWTPETEDRWVRARNMEQAAELIGAAPRRVLLTVGRQHLSPFAAHPRHAYLVRSIDPAPPEDLPPGAEMLIARGPFSEADEVELMRDRRIEVLVTKNSGGLATEAKLAAARALGLKVIVVDRPPLPDLDGMRAEVVGDAGSAFAWLERLHQASDATERGV